MPISNVFNMDCVDAMKQFADGFFDLAVVDPPYGSGGGADNYNRFGGRFDTYKRDENWRDVGSKVRKKIISWDHAPSKEYFDELFRVSKSQIIWGGNYFSLPPTRCFLVWRKTNVPENFSMAMAEYAWCSFDGNAKVIDLTAIGQQGRFHPTQKPIDLYKWIFRNYAKDGYKILDTHLGSGSSRIAAWDAGLDFWGYEIDKDYFDKMQIRFEEHTLQLKMDF